MWTRRATLRVVAVATLVAGLCGVALLGLESSLMLVPSSVRSATWATFLRGESISAAATGFRGSDFPYMGELMTSELIEQIESHESDCLTPMHVHLLWIGDLEKAPQERVKYAEMGYTLTVHTSAEEILEGFHPHVLKAFKLAVPDVVGYDFLKFALVYKYGGLAADADTLPLKQASEITFPDGCDLVFGKEDYVKGWENPIYRKDGGSTFNLNRPFQLLNWAMATSKPRNPHIKRLMEMSMMHFFGLRDMQYKYVQDIAGSGLMSDYMALLYEREGQSFTDVFRNNTIVPVRRACMADGVFVDGWIWHQYIGTWKN